MASFVSGGNTISKSYIEKELSKQITNSSPYNFRRTADGEVIGDNLVSYDTIVGGSVVWNQLVKNGNFASVGTWSLEGYGNYTVSNNMATVTLTTANSSARFQQPTSIVKGHKYFATATMKAEYKTNYHITFQTGGSGATIASKYTVEADTWATVCGIREAVDADLTSGVIRFYFGSANASVGDKIYVKNCMLIDLTALLTPDVADHIYTLEQANAGAGVAYFKKYFPEEYHEYCEPHFEHVQTSQKTTVGFNALDIDTYLGTGFDLSGTKLTNTKADTRTFFQPTIQLYKNGSFVATVATNYYSATGRFLRVFNTGNYDADSMLIKHSGSSMDINIARLPYSELLTNTDYCLSVTVEKNNPMAVGGLVLDELCLNIHGDRDGEYEPYKKRTYPLDSSLTLRGIPKLDSANRLCFDGDIYRHDGSGEYRFFELDMGTINWEPFNAAKGIIMVGLIGSNPIGKFAGVSEIANMFCQKYQTFSYVNTVGNASTDKCIAAANTTNNIYVYDSAYTDAAAFKAAMSGVYLLYELKTPEPFTAEPFQSPMAVDDWGTEEFVDYGVEQGDRDVAIPVGHETTYEYGVYGKIGEVYDSPTFYGTPTAPTAESGTNTNQIATTAFVQDAVGDFMQKGVDYVTAGQKSGTTLGTKATAEGENTTASGEDSHAEGYNTVASGNYSHAEGYNTVASESYSHAEGSNTEARGYGSHAEGIGTYAGGQYAHAEGSGTRATGEESHAEGYNTTAQRKSQHVFGEYNVLDTGGTDTTTRGTYVEIVGNGTNSARSNARTLDWSGNEVLAGKLTVGAAPTNNMDVATKQYVDSNSGVSKLYTATCPTAAGTAAKVATLDNSSGFSLTAGVRVAVTFTYGNTATTPTLNVNSTGAKTIVINSSTTGYLTGNGTTHNTWGAYETVIFTYTGSYWTHALSSWGFTNTLGTYYMEKGVDYVTAGQKSGTTLGTKATAEGNNTTASGSNAHAEGYNTYATEFNAHAEGENSFATGSSSHAEGYGTSANGYYSHSEGCQAKANGRYSHAEGGFTVANNKSQHVFGEYNIAEPYGSENDRGTYIEIVGNGSLGNESNARTLDWNGNEVLAGKLTLGAAPTANMDAVTKQYVDTKFTYGNTDLTAGTSTLAEGVFYAYYE